MANLVYLDESGTDGYSSVLWMAAVVVDEAKVRPLAAELGAVAERHLGSAPPADFEFHGTEIWNGNRRGKNYAYLKELSHSQRMSLYEDALLVLRKLALGVAHSSIDKDLFAERGYLSRGKSAYLAALQFLLEKLDRRVESYKIVIADQKLDDELKAVKMVGDMQRWGLGEFYGLENTALESVIDSIHFVRSETSPGVQLADLVAYILNRIRFKPTEGQPYAQEVRDRLQQIILEQRVAERQTWPQPKPSM